MINLRVTFDAKIKQKELVNIIKLRVTIHAKIKQKELVNISDVSNLIKNSNLYLKLETLATKAALKAEQGKIVKLQTHDAYYFPSRHFFGEDGSQNMFVYQFVYYLTC